MVVAGGGGGYFDHTNCFFAYNFIHQFRTLPENFSPRSSQVRSPGQVKWPYLKKYLGFRRDYSLWGINRKLSGVGKGVNAYKTFISEFWFRWPEVRSILKPHHYKAMGKWSYAVFPNVRAGTYYLSHDILILGHSRWPVCICDQMTSPSGHSKSYEGTFVFFASNFW